MIQHGEADYVVVVLLGHESWTQVLSVDAYLLVCQTVTRILGMPSLPLFTSIQTAALED